MDKKERFVMAYNYLKSKGSIHCQRDLSKCMGAAEGNVSRALKGDPKVLTDSFLVRFNTAFDYIFSMEWLANGDGEMLLKDLATPSPQQQPEPQSTGIDNLLEILSHSIRSVNDLHEQIKKELAEIQTVKSELQQARNDFRDAAYRLTQHLTAATLHPQPTYIGIAADNPSDIPDTLLADYPFEIGAAETSIRKNI